MADRYHLAGATDWGNAASWHDGVYGASAVPLDTEAVYFAEGQDAVVSNLDQNGVDLAFLYETPGFSGRVGSSGTSLKIEVTSGTGTFDKGGFGTWYIVWTTTGGGAGTCDVVNLRSGSAYILGGTSSVVNVWGGEHRFGDAAVLHQLPVTVKGGHVTIEYKSGDTPDVTVHSGTVLCERAIRTLIVKGGRVISRCMKAATAITTATVEGDGYLDLQAGVITTLNANDGTVDFSHMVKQITLTNSTFAGAKAVARTGANGLTVTYTNAPTITHPADGGGGND